MAVLEAAGVGLPIVVRNLSEYNDTFKTDVIRGSDASFTSTIERLSKDRAFYAEAVKGAQEVATRFDSQAGGALLVKAYQEIL